MTDNGDNPTQDGFEYGGKFYRWHVTDMGKDLMLIDRISGLPVTDFFDVIDDDHERGRGPIILTLIATSIRFGNPDWTVERVHRTVMNLNMSDVTFIDADQTDEEEDQRPPAESTEAVPPIEGPSPSPSNGSSSPAIQPVSSPSETLSGTPV